MNHRSGIFVQDRVGRKGVLFGMCKLVTMDGIYHPSSEESAEINKTKFSRTKRDTRITGRGELLRRYFIDELPQFYNILRGDMGLVGVRPLTPELFATLPEDLQRERVKYNPGLVDVRYAEGIYSEKTGFQNEREYLRRKAEHPILTDFVYFFKVMWNLGFNGARGK